MTSRTGTWLLRGATGLTLAFIYLPLLVILPVRVQHRAGRSSGRFRA